MAETDRVKRNIQKMIAQGAPEADIDAYVASEGLTAEMLRGEPTPAPTQQTAQPVTQPIAPQQAPVQPQPLQRVQNFARQQQAQPTQGVPQPSLRQNIVGGLRDFAEENLTPSPLLEGGIDLATRGLARTIESPLGAAKTAGKALIVDPAMSIINAPANLSTALGTGGQAAGLGVQSLFEKDPQKKAQLERDAKFFKDFALERGADTAFGALNAATLGRGNLLRQAVTAPVKVAPRPIPTTQGLKDFAKQNFKRADDIAVDFPPAQTDDLIGSINRDLARPEIGLDRVNNAKTMGLLRDFKKLEGQGINSGTLNALRKRASRVSNKEDKFTAGIVTENIDEFTRVNAPDVFDARQAGNKAFKQFKTAEALEKNLEKAVRNTSKSGIGGNLDNNTRAALEKLLTGKQGKFLSVAEQEAIDRVIKGHFGTNLARMVGKFSPTTGGLTALLSGTAAAASGGITAPFSALGFLSKTAADRATTRGSKKVLDLIRAGSPQAVKAAGAGTTTIPLTAAQKLARDKARRDLLKRIGQVGAIEQTATTF